MAIKEYQYQHATHDSLILCLTWAQNNLELRDWKIDLDTRSLTPRELLPDDAQGKVSFRPDYHKALIWVPLSRCKAENTNPYSLLLHEVYHVCVKLEDPDDGEGMTVLVEPLLYRLYCRETKLKLALERETE